MGVDAKTFAEGRFKTRCPDTTQRMLLRRYGSALTLTLSRKRAREQTIADRLPRAWSISK